jgi:hypothetical protein
MMITISHIITADHGAIAVAVECAARPTACATTMLSRTHRLALIYMYIAVIVSQ